MWPKMLARSGLAGKKKVKEPIWGHPRHFSMDQTNNTKLVKKKQIFLGRPTGPIYPVWGHVLVSSFRSIT